MLQKVAGWADKTIDERLIKLFHKNNLMSEFKLAFSGINVQRPLMMSLQGDGTIAPLPSKGKVYCNLICLLLVV